MPVAPLPLALLAHLHGKPVAPARTLCHLRPMAKMRKKSDLPEKICAHCARPFAWRKKWARDWDNVRYCSDACRAGKGPTLAGRE